MKCARTRGTPRRFMRLPRGARHEHHAAVAATRRGARIARGAATFTRASWSLAAIPLRARDIAGVARCIPAPLIDAPPRTEVSMVARPSTRTVPARQLPADTDASGRAVSPVAEWVVDLDAVLLDLLAARDSEPARAEPADLDDACGCSGAGART
jgi:hypothetical protein